MPNNANFDVDTSLIRGQVPEMRDKCQEFVTCYNNIIASTQNLVSVRFQGQTGQQFRDRIMEYQANIDSVCRWVDNCCTELTNYAQSIDEAEEQQRNLASQLRV